MTKRCPSHRNKVNTRSISDSLSPLLVNVPISHSCFLSHRSKRQAQGLDFSWKNKGSIYGTKVALQLLILNQREALRGHYTPRLQWNKLKD